MTFWLGSKFALGFERNRVDLYLNRRIAFIMWGIL